MNTSAAKSINTTCPYCGVGCGIEAMVDEVTREVKILGDNAHPANFGRLCSKGSALGETTELKGRLLEPMVYGHKASWPEALQLVADAFKAAINNYGPDAVAIYGSGQLLTEDYYVANKLMKGFIGSGNMDTNSRLCMSSSVAGHKRAFGSDTVPGCYGDYELADLMVLIGSNTAWCHPVSFQRIRAAKEANPKLKIVVIDPRKTVTCDIADLHLPIASGSDAVLFNGLLYYLASRPELNQTYINAHSEGYVEALKTAAISSSDLFQVAERCRIKADDILTFYDWFAGTEKVMSLYSQGINQSASGTDKVDAIINCHLATGRIGKPGMGPFSLTGQPNAMGGREVGGLSHQLAAHMDFSNRDDILRVARFWNSNNIAQKPGLSAVELFDAIYDGTIKAVWIMGTNPVVSLPNADKVKLALQRCEFVVVSDCIAQTDTTEHGHVLLPAQGWSEKEGTVTNSERCISRQRALFSPAGNAKPDWWILSQVAQRMGFGAAFNYQSPVDIFREHAALSGYENDQVHGLRDFDISALADISVPAYQMLQPIQWPVNKAYPNGRARMFDDGQYFTVSGKAQFIAVEPQLPINLPNAEYPLVLNTGRLRDQWHTMTRTAIAAKLNQHKPEPFVEIHPDDAELYGMQANSLALLESSWGNMLARVLVTDSQKPGNVFVPMHWTNQFANRGRMGALVNPVYDPISKQPESKHTPVRIKPYAALWYGFLLSRHELTMAGIEYCVKVKGEHFYRYELAGESLPANWQDWLLASLGHTSTSQKQCLEYSDVSKGNYRAAFLAEDKLEVVLFISAHFNLPERNWLTGLFAEQSIGLAERLALLTGMPPLGVEDTGAVVCACFNVGEKTILSAIKENGLKTHQEVGQYLKAGTNCGSCIPEIKAML
ncbi:MAG: molybdopterin-dependent oxidoreductase [Methylococcaceae bacterium]|jgi:assimilatory nitrate reductase catalytic subunit